MAFKGEGFLHDSAVLVDGMGTLSRLLSLHYVALMGGAIKITDKW